MKKFFLCIIVGTIFAITGAGQKRVAIFDPISLNRSIDEGTKSSIRDHISSTLVNTGKYIVVDRSSLDKIIAEQKFSVSGAVDDRHAIELGRLAGANKVVLSTITSVDGCYSFDIKLIDVTTAAIEQQKTEIINTKSLLNVIKPLTLELTGDTDPSKRWRKKTRCSGDEKPPSVFNHPKGYSSVRQVGISAGYVSKQWERELDNRIEKIGAWDETSNLNGIQAGIRFEPLFDYGLALNTGLFYEFYYSKTETSYNEPDFGYYCDFREHSIHVPLHLEFYLHLSESFSPFIYGGLSADYGISAKIKAYEVGSAKPYYTETEIYGNGEIGFYSKRFNASYDFGAGLRINGIRLSIGMSKGFLNHSNIVKQNKNLFASISWMIKNTAGQ